jgi:Protein of unknown function (DUF2934)
MIDPKAQQPKPQFVAGPKSSAAKETMMTNPVPSQERIRARAYELYQSRGGEPGHDLKDWLRAEKEVLKQER